MADRSLLNPSQARRLLALLTDVDEGLSRVEALCSGGSSPFAREQPDIAPEEVRFFASFVASARLRLLEACDRLGVERPAASISCRWSIETTLSFAAISFAELAPERMRGYGVLTPKAEEELAALSGALEAFAARGVALLREADAPLAPVAATIPGRAGIILRALERLTRERGLYEVRPGLQAALERATAKTLEVGVFGRVGAGKSSLLNALVGGDVLPVGATPVTAVPVILEHGSDRIEVHFKRGRVGTCSVEELRAVATEEGNPENRKDVQRVLVRIPSVPRGTRFLDTPGVGSLSTSGPALAYALLPRCDLGLVLVAAGAPVGWEEISLMRGLQDAGVPVVVLVSKADLLVPEERERATAYVTAELHRAFGPRHGVLARSISTRACAEQQLSALRRDVIEPAIRGHELHAEVSLGRRLARLVALTEEALAGRNTTLAWDMEDERVRRSTLAKVRSHTDALPGGGAALLERATTAVATAWKTDRDASRAAMDALSTAPGDAVAAVRSTLDRARAALGAEAPSTLPPLFDPHFFESLPDLRLPALGRSMLGHSVAARRMQTLAGELDAALSAYSQRLLSWAEGALAEMTHDAFGNRRAPRRITTDEPLQLLAAMARDMEAGRPESMGDHVPAVMPAIEQEGA